MSHPRRRALWLPAIFLIVAAPSAMGQTPVVHGRLERLESVRTLRVWGTPHEMGYAHGYLLADEIVEVLDFRMDTGTATDPARLDQMYKQLRRVIDVPSVVFDELRGMLKGIRARHDGHTSKIKAVNREVTIDDLAILNAGDMLRAFGCSGFTVWGDKAGAEGVITTRNFDYPARRRTVVESQMILVRAPKGQHMVATITWPGYLGAVTGLNDAGVCTFMHDGTGDRLGAPSGRQTPVALTLTRLLESADAVEAHTMAQTLLKANTPYPFSYMIRVVTPRVAGHVVFPEIVFRVDALGLIRNPMGASMSITTNHYLSAAFGPFDRANDWSLTRYARLKERLSGSVTARAAWEAQRSVASTYQAFPTLHTIVVYPERRRLDLAFAKWGEKVTPATESAPTTITFDALFGDD